LLPEAEFFQKPKLVPVKPETTLHRQRLSQEFISPLQHRNQAGKKPPARPNLYQQTRSRKKNLKPPARGKTISKNRSMEKEA